ncbi:LuxR family transcriptional regulator [Marinomonas sp. M1K-6]|uniref:LuxR family transcriptional regulator n=1 Tax=Marinomonas profundi TaxID=2726122 RepID=A0A847R2T6_9GAMM|nr:LuxR C-terminal-related transcriptional regulator [Marinomonas profundi]NLQ18132.1 LuxR family transcriptional regulator [Marinomonas profundi]UDV04084.1 LuxR family transcriptional regulator [Marinomonas profundi]
MRSAPLIDLIDKIYERGFNHQDWNSVLKLLCQAIDAKSAGLFFINFQQQSFRVLGQHGLPDSFTPSYQLELGMQDATAVIMEKIPAGIAHGAIDHETSKKEHPDFYQNLLLPNKIGYISALNIRNDKRYFVGIGVHRSMKQSQFNKEELRVLERLYPHLKRVFEFSDRLERVKEKESMLISALSRIPLGIISVDATLNVYFSNALAETLLNGKSGIHIENDVLIAHKSTDQRLIQASINKILAGQAVLGSLQIRQNELKKPLTIMFKSIHPETDVVSPIDNNRGKVVLYLSHPELCSFTTIDTLQETYHLTTAEAQLALSLANGLTLHEVADHKNTSIQTVRSQLKSIFLKMKINSQAELIRCILSSAYNLTS